MPDGFKVADAFVDVTTKLDPSGIARDARAAGEAAGAELNRSLGDAGSSSGESFGQTFSTSAEGRVKESRGRFASGFSGIFGDTGKSSGDSFGRGFGGSLLGGIGGTAKKAGGILSEGLSMGGKVGPYVGAAILVGVAATAPVAGAVLGGALLAGVTMAGVGAGIAAGIRDPEVKGAIADLKESATTSLNGITQDWAPTMLGAVAQIKGEVGGIGSELRSALAPARAYVSPLIDGLTGLIRGVMPGFRDALASAAPIVAVIKSGLSEFGVTLGTTLSGLAEHSDEFASGLQLAFNIAGMLVSAGGDILGWLAGAYATTLDWAVAFSGFLTGLPGVGDTFKGWHADLVGLRDTANGAGPALQSTATGLTNVGGAAASASGATGTLAARQAILNTTMAGGVAAAGSLKGALDALNGAAQSAEQAEIQFQDSVDAASAALKTNGATVDSNTAKGRANRSALLQLAQAGSARAQTIYEQTAATKGTTAAEHAAAGAYSNARGALIRSAQAMGMSAGEARKLADKIMGIPKNWSTKVKADTSQAASALAAHGQKLDGIPRSITTIVEVQRRYPANRDNADKLMSSGGPVHGNGPKGVDSVRTMLAPGEHVLSDKEVDAAGGHGAIEAWRAALRGNTRVSMPATSAPAATGSTVNRAEPARHMTFMPGSIVLDLSSMRTLGDLMESIENLGLTARTYRSATVFKTGATA